jgi:hypothetical protein
MSLNLNGRRGDFTLALPDTHAIRPPRGVLGPAVEFSDFLTHQSRVGTDDLDPVLVAQNRATGSPIQSPPRRDADDQQNADGCDRRS